MEEYKLSKNECAEVGTSVTVLLVAVIKAYFVGKGPWHMSAAYADSKLRLIYLCSFKPLPLLAQFSHTIQHNCIYC